MTENETIRNLLPPLRALWFLLFSPGSFSWTYRKLQHGALRFLPSPAEMWRVNARVQLPLAGINRAARSKETITRTSQCSPAEIPHSISLSSIVFPPPDAVVFPSGDVPPVNRAESFLLLFRLFILLFLNALYIA